MHRDDRAQAGGLVVEEGDFLVMIEIGRVEHVHGGTGRGWNGCYTPPRR